ncbi:MAG: hypothetical protein Q8J85_00360 [Sulfuricurvum sp.]|nr:hypothetical protein [Sulfuricurvum sp.]MDP3021702.1 hypothetical protein [Sulfuricurvum sp.]
MPSIEHLAKQALTNKDFQEAVNLFKRALERNQTPDIWSGLAIAYENLHAWPEARWASYKALELDSSNTSMPILQKRIEAKEANEEKSTHASGVFFRVAGEQIQINKAKKWEEFTVRGINLGLGLPGFYPGEFAITRGTYLEWFALMQEAGFNTVRIYTLHPPAFYRALAIHNQKSVKKLYLIQEIWLELPEDNDFNGIDYSSYVTRQIRNAVDAIYGNLILLPTRGNPEGHYVDDVSQWTHSFLLGREWETCAVSLYNTMMKHKEEDYLGKFIKIKKGTPFETWIAAQCDAIQTYETTHYRDSHPVSVVNWPTLDPLEHWSEASYYDGLKSQGLITTVPDECQMDEDVEQLDLAKFSSIQGGGIYATYHVYPYYPDFLLVEDLASGNPYGAYLKKLKTHHKGMPIVIGEFGVPSSRDAAHWHPLGWNHGGLSEKEQGEINVKLIKTIFETGLSGEVLFSWFDEWFKNNRLFVPYHLPAHRRALWFNAQNAEQTFGLLGMYPGYPNKKCTLSANSQEWEDAQLLYEGNVQCKAMSDEGFLYFQLKSKEKIDFDTSSFLIGLGTCGDTQGEHRLPLKSELLSPVALTFCIELSGKKKSRILITAPYDKYLNHTSKVIRPITSIQGGWVEMVQCVNERRLSKDLKRFYPPRFITMSPLRFGTLLCTSPAFNSLSDFYYDENTIEVRLPWALLNVTDPSSKSVLWMDNESSYRKTDGINVVLLDQSSQTPQFTPISGQKKDVKAYQWDEWNTPTYHTEIKESYKAVKEYYALVQDGKK